MSRQIIILKCECCGRELGRKEEGETVNPNGVIGNNRQIFTVNQSLCPHCTPKEVKK